MMDAWDRVIGILARAGRPIHPEELARIRLLEDGDHEVLPVLVEQGMAEYVGEHGFVTLTRWGKKYHSLEG